MSESDGSESPTSGFLPESLRSTFADIARTAAGFSRDSSTILDSVNGVTSLAPAFNPAIYELPEIHVDTSPRETAEHTARVAEATDTMSALMADLVAATTASLQLSEQARRDNQEAQKTTHRMSVASLWVSIASLAAAVGSIVVAVIALVTGH